MATIATTFDESQLNTELNALASGQRWDNSAVVTYFLRDNPSGTYAFNWDTSGASTAIRQVFDLFSSVANITFEEVFTEASANLIQTSGSADGALAFHFFPGDSGNNQSLGEYNTTQSFWTSAGLVQGGYAFNLLIHELGHGLGLEHPFDGDTLSLVSNSNDYGDFGLNQGVFSVMSYNDGWLGTNQFYNAGYGSAGTPMAFDIAALQALYGANMSHATDDDVYALVDSNGSGTFYSTIWDAGGADSITYDGSSDAVIHLTAATIDTTPTGAGLMSYVDGIFGGFTIAQGVTIENATSGAGDDLLAGNEANNVLVGNGGDDLLIGMDGDDSLVGGDGNDLLIGDYNAFSPEPVELDTTPEAATLPTGLSLGGGSLTSGQTTANNTTGTATDISGQFAFVETTDVLGGTNVPNVSISGTGNNQFDYFSFTVSADNVFIALDIDGTSTGYDSVIRLLDSSGAVVAENDDAIPEVEGTGSSVRTDSFLTVTLPSAGTYYVQVGSYTAAGSGITTIGVGQSYTLHVSASENTPIRTAVYDDGVPLDSYESQLIYYFETPGLDTGAVFGDDSNPDKPHVHDYACFCHQCKGSEEPGVSETSLEDENPADALGAFSAENADIQSSLGLS